MTGQVDPVTLPRPSDFLVDLVVGRSEVDLPNPSDSDVTHFSV